MVVKHTRTTVEQPYVCRHGECSVAVLQCCSGECTFAPNLIKSTCNWAEGSNQMKRWQNHTESHGITRNHTESHGITRNHNQHLVDMLAKKHAKRAAYQLNKNVRMTAVASKILHKLPIIFWPARCRSCTLLPSFQTIHTSTPGSSPSIG